LEALNYKLEQFEGPLDLLLDLVAKNKVDISDIPIALICEQYLDYIAEAERLDMELASEFLTMASYLILIKSKMLLPRKEKEEEDPREDLAFVMREHLRSQQLALILRERYSSFGGRIQKDTDEISPDRTFALDQDVQKLYEAARRVLAYQRTERTEPIEKITPIIKKKIIPVEEKIVGILTHFKKKKKNSLKSVLSDARSRPELIAIFIGVLELIKQRRIIIVESPEEFTSLHGMNTVFEFNENYSSESAKEAPSSEYN
jgi:segregation and condensation protein A